FSFSPRRADEAGRHDGRRSAMSYSKRDLLRLAAGLGAVFADNGRAGAEGGPTPTHVHDMSVFPAHWHGTERIAFLVYPQFTALDVVGPHYMLASLMGATVDIVAK